MILQTLLEDLRCIIGTLFLIFGLILLSLGLFGPEPAAGQLNLNLITGVAMFLFAAFMLALGIRAEIVARAASATPAPGGKKAGKSRAVPLA